MYQFIILMWSAGGLGRQLKWTMPNPSTVRTEVHNTYRNGHCGFGAKYLDCDSREESVGLENIYRIISSKLSATVLSIVLDWVSALPVEWLEGLRSLLIRSKYRRHTAWSNGTYEMKFLTNLAPRCLERAPICQLLMQRRPLSGLLQVETGKGGH